MKGLKLSDDYKAQYILILGDGLSQICEITFIELIEETSYIYGGRNTVRGY